ncbi:MAG: AAA family ATPase, partial [Chloroflexi bacterium]|nr:AAA family ATPase [Chloroflexota bacterium]
GIWLDIAAFRQGLTREDIASWLAALDLYTADLLEELDHFWLLSQRAELRELYLTALQRSCAALIDQGKTADALTLAQRWTTADSLNETAHINVIQLQAQLGRYAAALQQYETLVQLLADELDVAPLLETQALVADLRRQREAITPVAAPSMPLVGRQVERNRLMAALERLSGGQGGLILVQGDPGMGKTCLLQALAEAAEWRQIRVAWGKTDEHSNPQRHAPLPDALQAATVGARLDRVAMQLTPLLRDLLTPFLPKLNNSSAHRSVLAPEKEPPKLPLTTAVHKLLTTLCQTEPHLLLLDDVQWADNSFWELVPTLVQVSREESLLLILSYRSQELRENEAAWTAVRQADQDIAPEKLLLKGFSADEFAEFAAQMGSLLSSAEQMQLLQLSGGNPLAAKELLLSDNPAASFATMLAERLAQLAQNEREALFAAAVLGREFRHGTWQTMFEAPIPLQSLLNGRFLNETTAGYAFQHDLVRAACYQSQSVAEQQQWHQRAGMALLREGSDAATLAWHFEQGQQWETAVHYHRRAAERAVQLQDMASAETHCKQALTLLVKTAVSNEDLPLRCLRLHIQQRLAWASTSLKDAQILVQQAREEEDFDALLQALLLTLNYFVGQGQLDELQAVVQEIVQLAQELSDPGAEIQALNQVAYALLFVFGDAEKAIGYSDRALALAQAL